MCTRISPTFTKYTICIRRMQVGPYNKLYKLYVRILPDVMLYMFYREMSYFYYAGFSRNYRHQGTIEHTDVCYTLGERYIAVCLCTDQHTGISPMITSMKSTHESVTFIHSVVR